MSFSPEFTAFIRENVISVEQIRVLLLLSADAGRWWTVDEISAELTSSPRSIHDRLLTLRRRALVHRDDRGRFSYVPDPAWDGLVAQLREEYAQRPVSVIELIFSRREGALESFSQAFRLGGDDGDR